LVAVLVPASALALPPSTPDPNAWVPDNYVNAVLHHGTTTWVGGQFDQWGPFTGEAASLAPSDGAADPGFPRITGGPIAAAVPDGSGGTYLAGSFTAVGGQPVAPGVTHLSASGQVLFSIAVGDGSARALVLDPAGVLYVGGDFGFVAGIARDRLAAITTSTGALVTTWKACVDGGDHLVAALALSGSTLYAGGDFDEAGILSSGGSCATTTPRDNAAAFSTASGSAVAAWDPQPNAEVDALAPNAAGSLVYLGGQFSMVGTAALPHLAVVASATGAPSTGWAPAPNNSVSALALGSGGAIYAGGRFTTIGSNHLARTGLAEVTGTGVAVTAFDAHLQNAPNGEPPIVAALAVAGSPQRLYVGGVFDGSAAGAPFDLAAADPTTGTLDGAFAPSPGGYVLAIAAGPQRVVAGGAFQSIGATRHAGAVALDGDGHPLPGFTLSDPAPVERMVLSPDGGTIYAIGAWPTKQLGAFSATTGQALPFSVNANGIVEAIALSPDGHTLYLGGTFEQVDGQPREHLAAVDTATGALTAWKPEPDATVSALAIDGSTIYVGGAFAHIGPAVDTRANLAALSAATGDPTAWNPSPNAFVNVIAVAPDSAHVYVGGAFTTIGASPQARGGVAELTTSSGNPTPFRPEPVGQVNELVPTADGNTVYAAGPFSAIGADSVGQFARLDSGVGQNTNWSDSLPDQFVGSTWFDADGDTVWLGTNTSPPDGRKFWVQYTAAPVVAAAPTLSSAPAVGSAVGCGAAVWRNAPARVTTTWTLDGATIAGATGESYAPVAGDVGRALACVQVGANSAGSATAASAGQAVGAGASPPPGPPAGGGDGLGAAPGPGSGSGSESGTPLTPPVVKATPKAPTLKVRVKSAATARKGISLTFTLSAAATVSATFQRVRPGRLVGKQCHPPGKHPHGRTCDLLTTAGSATWKSGTKKTLTVVLRRLKGKALTAGSYRATFTARVGSGPRSKAVVETIRVR
jgi:hypothetical protein